MGGTINIVSHFEYEEQAAEADHQGEGNDTVADSNAESSDGNVLVFAYLSGDVNAIFLQLNSLRTPKR